MTSGLTFQTDKIPENLTILFTTVGNLKHTLIIININQFYTENIINHLTVATTANKFCTVVRNRNCRNGFGMSIVNSEMKLSVVRRECSYHSVIPS